MVVTVAEKLEDTVQPVFGLGFAMKDADHDADAFVTGSTQHIYE